MVTACTTIEFTPARIFENPKFFYDDIHGRNYSIFKQVLVREVDERTLKMVQIDLTALNSIIHAWYGRISHTIDQLNIRGSLTENRWFVSNTL